MNVKRSKDREDSEDIAISPCISCTNYGFFGCSLGFRCARAIVWDAIRRESFGVDARGCKSPRMKSGWSDE